MLSTFLPTWQPWDLGVASREVAPALNDKQGASRPLAVGRGGGVMEVWVGQPRSAVNLGFASGCRLRVVGSLLLNVGQSFHVLFIFPNGMQN